MNITEIRKSIAAGRYDSKLEMLYGKALIPAQKKRFDSLLRKAKAIYGDREAHLITAPGRTEVGGNHTDHQLGRVLAASINLDVAAVVIPVAENEVRYAAPGFQVKPVQLKSLKPSKAEKNTTESLIRGTAARFRMLGYQTGGFYAYAESDVLPGSGMSSSAAFEVLLGTIFNVLYNQNRIDPVEIAKIGQYAENNFFMKPCGLLDQMACSVGGFVTIDFKKKDAPVVKKIPFDFAKSGYELVLTDCKQSHADLSDEYGLVPGEMKAVARVLGKTVLSEVTMAQFLKASKKIREKCGDRAWLRAFHFLNETDRVTDEVKALKTGDMNRFLQLIVESGYSSFMYLQNVYYSGDVRHQSLPVGLALSEEMLKGKGAYRVHGGGFAGTIQAFVPLKMKNEYRSRMESVFGKGCCYELSIRPVGGYCIL
jgi:galactokinase